MFSSQNSQVSSAANYIEDVFSTYLYTGNGSTQTITNGIDLAGKGGLVWTKARVDRYHNLEDTVRGAGNSLWSNSSSANYYYSDAITSFGSTGYTLGADGTGNQVNSSANYVSWTFREQPKFFDVVTYTGNGGVQNIPHNLGSVPGCFIVKRTDSTGDWYVNHRSFDETGYLKLNSTDPVDGSPSLWDSTYPTSTQFTLGNTIANTSGATYVAYLFAHNAGGFGLTGTDNVISCGSFTTGGSGDFSVTLGYEPQWVLLKQSSGAGGSWVLFDTMRGMSNTNVARLIPNTSGAETNYSAPYCVPSATGFYSTAGGFFDAGETIIYIAIRRGPMKVPTSGTSVFNPVLADTSAPTYKSSNFNTGVDSGIEFYKPGYTGYPRWSSRLTGTGQLATSGTAAEVTDSLNIWPYMNGYYNASGYGTDSGSWMFKRAPSFFDEVCYTGNGTGGRTVTHNLGVAPELMIFKNRTTALLDWIVGGTVFADPTADQLKLNTTGALQSGSSWNYTAPTSTTITLSSSANLNANGANYVAYLFATCAGVSKVGSYTGTGTTKQVDCGFTGGARFVLIKRTDSTGDWYVWDSARGIVSGNDPYLLLNSTAAETTGTDYIDTYSAGFEISSTAPAAINASGGTFIFLAIA